MPIVDLGETYSWRVQVKNDAGVLGAPATGPTVTLTLPDGSAGTAPTVTTNAPGDYYVETPITAAVGRHVLTATAAGGQLGTGVTRKWSDAFEVDDPAGLSVVSYAEIVDEFGLDSENPETVRVVLARAASACADYAGRQLWRRSFTEVYDGGVDALRLRRTPAQSISSVIEGTTSLAASGYTLDPLTGLLHRGPTTGGWWWATGRQNITVTYVAGFAAPSPSLRLAVIREFQHLWQATQALPHPAIDDTFNAGNEFATTYNGPGDIPSQVRYLLAVARDELGAGVAGPAVGV